MSKPKPAPLPAGTVVGGYSIVKKLAAGGFGVVYLAEDSDRHLVAVKEYLPASLAERSPGELTPRVKPEKQPLYRLGLKSFFEEGRSLAQISHPSVVSVLNFFRENETVYMVMNYLQGDTLQDFIVTARDLKRDKVFRESTIRSLFDEILRGLRIVHQHKMLHLDIKPANIFITNDNKAVMLDFGAAREVLSKEGNFIRPMYTPGFAAPEMYRRDGTLGPWTDIYAIGACIYACMQGYPPNDAPQRLEKDRLALSLLAPAQRLFRQPHRSDRVVHVAGSTCRGPQSVFALQKELSRETERRYTKLSFSERLKLQLQIENLKSRREVLRRTRTPRCAFPSTRSAARAAARRTKTAWAIATRGSGLFALADGMGGHPEGEVASQLALQMLAAMFQREAKPA
jgi:serine/threonine protein kinase